MTFREFVEKAVQGGYKYDMAIGFGNGYNPECFYHMLLDPKAWEAVGKTEGWEEKFTAQYVMREMCDALCDGKSISKFIETL